MKSRKGTPYDKRLYRKDLDGKMLHTTVMYDGDERIEGTGKVIERLRIRLLNKAKEVGSKNLSTRDFIDAFRTRGPKYGDVVRQVIRELHAQGKIRMRNIGTEKKPRYVYDLVLFN